MVQVIIRPVTTVYASDLGLKPGEWPLEVQHEGWTWITDARGVHGPDFFFAGGELRHVTYWANGRKLIVVND